MVKVENAIILAAGIGSRMVPLTYDRPKGLVEVRGESLVERQIKQLIERDIREIILVTGYKKNAFSELEKKYKGIVQTVYNPDYNSKNNISSLFLVRNHLKNSYILSSDNYYMENIFKKEEKESWYCTIKDVIPRNEWGLDINQNGKIVGIHKMADANQPFMYGAVFFTADFSYKFCKILESEYTDLKTHSLLWEEILKKHIAVLDINAKLERKEVVYEIESFEELREFDSKYKENSGNYILSLIARIFEVKEKEIVNIEPQKLGMTNDSFIFSINGTRYIFRLPGKGSEKFINRQKEKKIYEKLKDKNITDQVVYFDEETGIKISKYEEKSRHVTIKEKKLIKKAIHILREVHQSGIVVEDYFGIESCRKYEEIAKGSAEFFEGYEKNKRRIEKLLCYLKGQGVKPVLCHTDFIKENILYLQDGEIRLIDWEYASMSEPMVDLAVFIICGWYQEEELIQLARYYYERELSDLEYFRLYLGVALSAIAWAAWTRCKQFQGDVFNEENYPERIYSYVDCYLIKAENYLERLNGKKRDSK